MIFVPNTQAFVSQRACMHKTDACLYSTRCCNCIAGGGRPARLPVL